MHEVRSTADSDQSESGAKPSWNKKHRQARGAWGGWRLDVWKRRLSSQGYLFRDHRERDRSQSPHSSEEAGNDRGAKGGRKVET
jgi:hypothetical protein